MKKKLDKASVHSGRANSRGVAYNPNHNTLEQPRVNQPHIDQERIHLNQYLQYMGDGTAVGHRGGRGGYDSRKHELERYRQLYGEGLEARNQRYRASGHRERVKTMSQVYRDPKTAPMETIFQLGNPGCRVPGRRWNSPAFPPGFLYGSVSGTDAADGAGLHPH